MSDGHKRIGDLLVDAGVITRADLERIIASRGDLPARRLLSELYLAGIAGERPLAEALAKQVGAPVVVLTESVIDLAALRLVPEDIVRGRTALPIAVDDANITIATPDPDAAGLIEPIAFATGKRVIAVLGLAGVMQQLIARAFDALAERPDAALFHGGTAKVIEPAPPGTPDNDPRAPHKPSIVVATPRASRTDADALAKAILDAIGDTESALDASDASRNQHKIGAIRLKRVLAARAPQSAPTANPAAAALEDVTLDDIAIQPLPPASAEPGPPLALVVDDDKDILRMLSRLLAVDGIAVREAGTGTDAVALMRVERPQVVLLDAMLPGIHGFEICAQMKRSEVLRHIPVIMISAVYRGWVLHREITELHGADFFVEKPFDTQYIRSLVADVLRRPAPRPPKVAAVQERVAHARERYERHAARELWFAAEADVATWLSLDPFDGRGWLERGTLRAQSGDLVAAMSAFEAAGIYEPSLFFAHVALAHVSERLGFVRRARASWEKARALATDDTTRGQIEAHLRRG